MSLRATLVLATAFASGVAMACMEPQRDGDLAVVRTAIQDHADYLALPADSRSAASLRIEEGNGRVLEIARRCGQRCPPELRAALLDFVLANEGSADEQVAEAALEIYLQFKSGFCADLGARPAAHRQAILEWARDGAALTQPEPVEVACP